MIASAPKQNLSQQKSSPHISISNGLDTSSGSNLRVDFGAPTPGHVAYNFSRIPIQPKLTVNTPGDIYEQEADRVAEQVMRMPEPQLQRACACRGDGAKCQTDEPRPERVTLQTKNIGPSDSAQTEAPPLVHEVLASPGQPLDASTRAFMEPRFGHDFSKVRVHRGDQASASARTVSARAYTIGERIVLGPGESFASGNRHLLAHELAHVVQQRSAPEIDHPLQLSESGQRIARQKVPTPQGGTKGKPTVLDTHASSRPRRTRVRIALTAHASPRWISAHSDTQADIRNLALSHQREQAVRQSLERMLRQALPDQQLLFEDVPPPTVDPGSFDDTATIGVESTAVGSQQTLQEAGKAGHHANETPMRRVDLIIDLSSAIDTIQDTKVQETRELSGATRRWSIKMGMGMQIDEGVGGGIFNFRLKNRKTGQEVEGWGEYGVGGLSAGLPIPTVDMGGYEDFETNEPANFSDFDYKRFTVGSAGVNALVAGWEWSSMTIYGLPGGAVDDIDLGGFVMGGAGIDLGSGKFGMIWLRETPDTYTTKVVRDQRTASTSVTTKEEIHRVTFETGKADISPEQEKRLRAYVESTAENYQRGGVYD